MMISVILSCFCVGHVFSNTLLVTFFIQRLQTFFVTFYVFNVFKFCFERVFTSMSATTTYT